MKNFDEAALGRIAKRANAMLRDLKRSTREQFGEAFPAPHTPERTAAADAVIAALAAVDRAFAAYHLSASMSYCDCCTDPELIARLITTPRDDLSDDDVASVVGSLLFTLGNTNDLKYFVPRFLRDTLATPLYDIDSMFARFERAGFDGWPDAERSAVRGYLRAFWRCVLLTSPCRGLTTLTDPWLDVLDGMASLGFIGDALALWDAEHGDAAQSRLLDLLDFLDVGPASFGVVGVGGYAHNSAGYDVLERWLRSPVVSTRIDAALEPVRSVDGELANRIDGVLSALTARQRE